MQYNEFEPKYPPNKLAVGAPDIPSWWKGHGSIENYWVESLPDPLLCIERLGLSQSLILNTYRQEQ